MRTQLGLSSNQQRAINIIGKRMAEHQAAFLRGERECLTEFTRLVGYASPDDARQLVIEFLQQDEAAGQVAIFDEDDWPKALTRIALKQIQEWANEEITAALDKLNSW